MLGYGERIETGGDLMLEEPGACLPVLGYGERIETRILSLLNSGYLVSPCLGTGSGLKLPEGCRR